jgi:hypothetical protein
MRWRSVFDDAQIRTNPFKLMVAGVTSTLGLDGESTKEENEEVGKSEDVKESKAGDAAQLFALPLAEHTERFEHLLTAEELWERFATLGHVAEMDGEGRAVSFFFPCSFVPSTFYMIFLYGSVLTFFLLHRLSMRNSSRSWKTLRRRRMIRGV